MAMAIRLRSRFGICGSLRLGMALHSLLAARGTEMHQSARFILFAEQDRTLHECEMQKGREQACCNASDQTAGQHTLDHGALGAQWHGKPVA